MTQSSFTRKAVVSSCTLTFKGTLLAGAVVAGAPLMAQAQVLEEVIVTSRRAAESLQDTPVSVIAMTGDKLNELNITDLGNLDAFTPNLVTGNAMGNGFANVTIRGIGGGQGQISQEGGVGIYIDDIYYPRANGALLDLVDVERVEVLRGPQGTLFGRNTSGGAVRYISKRPDTEFGGKFTGTYGRLDHREVNANINIPLSDTIATRFSFASKEKGGFVKRLNDGVKMGDENVTAARGQIRWMPTTDLDINLSIDRVETENDGIARNIDFIDPTNLAPTILLQRTGQVYDESLLTGDRFTVAGGDPERNTYETTGVTLTADYIINDNLTLKSLTGYRDSESTLDQDWDASEFVLYHANKDFEFSNISQEFQINGSYDRMDWVAGVYYMNEEAYEYGERFNAIDPPGLLEVRDVDTTSYAAFGQGSYNLTQDLRLTLGLRYSVDDKEYFGIRGPSSAGNSDKWYSTTTRFGVDYHITEDVMVYASAAEGFKAGGFNDRPRPGRANNGIVPYNPEELWTYEAGIRTEFDRVRFNATYFYTDYDDIQVSAAFFDPNVNTFVQVYQNAATATVEGIEFDLMFLATERLTLRASGGWIDAGYDEVGTADNIQPDTPLQRTPEFSYTLGATYHQPLSSGDVVVANLDYGWKDKQWSNDSAFNGIWLPSYGLLNGRLTYESADGGWSASLFGTNLLDEEYLLGAFDSTREGFAGFAQHDLGRPREYGIELSVNF